MTPSQYSKQLTELYGLVSGDLAKDTIAVSGRELLFAIKQRVTKQGKGSNENSIGQYSTKPIYVEKQKFVKKGSFKRVGKYGERTKRTMYLPEGYKELRDIQGLRTDVVNLKYSGSMVNDYQSLQVSQHVYLGIMSEKNAKKYEGLTMKYGNFYQATQQEKEEYIARTNFLLNRLTVNTITRVDVTATIE